MRLSSKGEYGLLALIDLAMHTAEGPVQIHQIARRQGIPKQYLGQLMLALKKAGLIHSMRGRQGGYVMARPAHAITLLERRDRIGRPCAQCQLPAQRPEDSYCAQRAEAYLG